MGITLRGGADSLADLVRAGALARLDVAA